jgi:hypothetical protein
MALQLVNANQGNESATPGRKMVKNYAAPYLLVAVNL